MKLTRVSLRMVSIWPHVGLEESSVLKGHWGSASLRMVNISRLDSAQMPRNWPKVNSIHPHIPSSSEFCRQCPGFALVCGQVSLANIGRSCPVDARRNSPKVITSDELWIVCVIVERPLLRRNWQCSSYLRVVIVTSAALPSDACLSRRSQFGIA